MGPELDLRPQLERLDRLICWSEDIDEGALSCAFRPLWQLDEPAKAALALSRAQVTQVYAGLKLWPDAVMAKLAEAQLVQDGTYPNAAAVFGEQAGEVVKDAREVGAVPHVGGSWPGEEEPRDWHGRWARVAGTAPRVQGVQVAQAGEDPIAGGDPDIDEHLRKMLEEQERLPHIGPALVPKEKPDGTIERADPSGIFFAAPRGPQTAPVGKTSVPPAPTQGPPSIASPTQGASTIAVPPPLASTVVPRTGGAAPPSGSQGALGRSPVQVGKNSPPYFPEFEDSPIYEFFRDRFTASPGDLTRLKSEMPDDIARHMIDGFIGPGPFAQDPIKLSPVGKITDEMIGYNDIIGYGFGCHRCGTRDPGTQNGSFILDHELPQALNFGDWMYRFYPHYQICANKQGGHVRVVRSRLRREGLIP